MISDFYKCLFVYLVEFCLRLYEFVYIVDDSFFVTFFTEI